MVKVTNEQVDYILNDIAAHGIVIEDLQYNLLDHMCCIIENEMPTDADFYKFYERILPRFFSDELREIQVETDKLLTFKDYYAMKNTLKISGIISSVLTLLGATFKAMHWPGAGVMIVLGVAIFSLLFLPLMIMLKFKDEEKPVDKWVLSLGLLLGIGASIGTLFKIMHWPGANILMLGSISAFVFAYVPLYFITRFRRAELKFNTTVNSVLMMACGGLLFGMFNLGYSTKYVESIAATHNFLEHNTTEMNKANTRMESSIQDYNGFEEMHKASSDLFSKIERIKVSLVAKVEGVSLDQAKNISLFDMEKPNDYKVVSNDFVHAEGELSLNDLLADVTSYNSKISSKYPNQSEKVLAIEKLQLDQIVISVLLHEFTQIQLQLATNENSYLSLLATK